MPRDEQRLRELNEQKRRLEHVLVWIEREIDAIQNGSDESNSQSDPETPPLESIGPSRIELSSQVESDPPRIAADPASQPEPNPESLPQPEMVATLYDELGPDTQSARQSVRRGCLFYVAVGAAVAAAILAFAISRY